MANSPEAVLMRAEAALAGLGFRMVEVEPGAGRLRAHWQDEGETAWAQCADAVAYDPDGDRRRRAPARGLDLDLALSVSGEQDGSAVALRPRFERTYLNSFTNLEFARPCRSTGELERTIFELLQTP